jgi:hypothetical protein
MSLFTEMGNNGNAVNSWSLREKELPESNEEVACSYFAHRWEEWCGVAGGRRGALVGNNGGRGSELESS